MPDASDAAKASALVNRRRRNNEAVSDTTDCDERNSHDDNAQPPLAMPKQHAEHKLKKLVKRLLVGSSLLVMLVAVLSQGHLATLGLVLAVQVAMFRELVNVRYRARTVQTTPLFRTSQWGWFVTCMLYSYSSAFSDESLYALLSPTNPVRGLLRYASFVTLLMYSLLLMVFVLTLRRGVYKHQVGQLAWTIAIIVLTVVQVQAFTQNIFAGLFWFLYPVGLVVCNDSMAYFCGLALGRKITTRPFLTISPNKTWEGFVGGGICTIVFAFFFPLLVVRYTPALACPCEHLLGSPLELKCGLPEVFAPAVYDVGIRASLDSLQRRFLRWWQCPRSRRDDGLDDARPLHDGLLRFLGRLFVIKHQLQNADGVVDVPGGDVAVVDDVACGALGCGLAD